jgi:RHS repeat-associated protein
VRARADRERCHRNVRPHRRRSTHRRHQHGHFLTHNLGSIVGIVSSTGVKTASYAYDPYGRTRTATGFNAAANAIRYAGGLYDTTTGATRFGARYYDPNTGRFTQPDPSGQEQNPTPTPVTIQLALSIRLG